MLTPLPQEEFNPTDDRKSEQPSLGVACLDCHIHGHKPGQFHWVHSLAIDSHGDVFTTEVDGGDRVQRFVPAAAPASRPD